MQERFPALGHLLGAYFHQDWDLVYGDDEWVTVDTFLRQERKSASALPREIDRLLDEVDDAGLDAYLWDERACYVGGDFPGGPRGWLTEIARRARLGPDDSLLPAPFTDWRSGRYSTYFTDDETGDEVTSAVIDAHRDEIERWLGTEQDRLVIEGAFPKAVGTVGNYAMGMSEQHVVRVILVQDADQPRRFRVVTSFPEFPRRGRTDLPGLRHLTDAYLYGDWDGDTSYDNVIAAFATGSGHHADALLEEIERLRPLSEEELEALLDEFGFQFSLVRDETWHGWLDDLAARIEEARSNVHGSTSNP